MRKLEKNILLFLIFLGSVSCYAKKRTSEDTVLFSEKKPSENKTGLKNKSTSTSIQKKQKPKKKIAKKESKRENNADLKTDIVIADSQKSHKKRQLVDKMVSIVHGPERSQIFCLSDQTRRGIDGRPRSLDDSIGEELIYQEAIRFKIPIDDVVVKEHLTRTMQMFGLKAGQEETIFVQEGYTYQEGFEKFRLMYANNMMIEYRIKQGMLIAEEEVITYYNANPIEKEAKCLLQTAFIPVDKDKGQKARGVEIDIDRFIKTGTGINIEWTDAYWVLESDLAEGLDFIITMQEGDIQKQKVVDGFQLYEMKKKKSKRMVPLKKRYRDIVEILRKPKFETTFQKYRKSLFDAATIVHL